MGWNTDLGELSFGGKFKVKGKKFYFFNNATYNLSDDYFGPTANQIHSSIIGENDSLWAPRQSNQFTHTFKISHELNSKTKISITNQHSLTINQNTRTLQIVGFDAILRPGFQFERSLNFSFLSLTYLRLSGKFSVFEIASSIAFGNLHGCAVDNTTQFFSNPNFLTAPIPTAVCGSTTI